MNKIKEKFYLELIDNAYSSNKSITEVALKNNIKPNEVHKIKRKYGIKTKRFVHNKRINENIELEMIRQYKDGKSSYKIAKNFGYKTANTVLEVLKKHKVKAKKDKSYYTNYNINVFNRINSHDKSYVLGLLYTDGYVYKNYKGICIQLTKGDSYLLKRIAKFFGQSATVINIDCSYKRKELKNAKDMSRLGVYCEKISKDLKNLGVVKNKTYFLSITNKIPKKYIYSFLRGVIDGDGTLGIAKNKNIWCQISTRSEKFAKDLCDLEIPEKFTRTCNSAGQWTVRLSGGNKVTKKFLKKIYSYKRFFYLERKYEKIRHQID